MAGETPSNPLVLISDEREQEKESPKIQAVAESPPRELGFIYEEDDGAKKPLAEQDRVEGSEPPFMKFSPGTFVHLNMQNKDVKKYNNVLIEGKLYSVKIFLVFTHYYMYKTCDHKYMIRRNYKTQVKAIKSKAFSTKMFQLKSYDSLKDPTQVNDKVLFDLIGRVVEIHAPVDKIIGGRPAKLLDFKMADNEGNTLQCTVWDSHVGAMLPYYDAGEVRITSCYDATQLHFNASYQEFAYFRFQLTAAKSPLRSINTATMLSQSTGIDDFTSGALTVTTVVDLLKKKQNGDFYVPAEIVGIEGSFGWMYISCMSPGCNRKLYEQSGDLICTNCDKKYKQGMARYRVRVIVLDKGLRDAPFFLWDRECSELVGIPAHSLYTKYNKVFDIPKELESLVGMRMVFKISLKMEFMKGANSAYTVMRVLRDEALVSARDVNLARTRWANPIKPKPPGLWPERASPIKHISPTSPKPISPVAR
ncbi:PREDICTED: uncharacterized protein LOC109178835 [Ipomoea nil]|uniref:uncharacterized protein LOC109178835 n=1 Tax=Ipomoea nil TaxID=35883 RepID=UPI000901443E|nr:PREDICTED: uncharacterized protein LOC109178835 [Ipomoea nil]